MFEYVHILLLSTVTFYTLSFVVNGFADACAKYSKRRTTNFKLKPISEILQSTNFYKADVEKQTCDQGDESEILEEPVAEQSTNETTNDAVPESKELKPDVKCCKDCCGAVCKCS